MPGEILPDPEKEAAVLEVLRIIKEGKGIKRFAPDIREKLEDLKYTILDIGGISLAQMEAEKFPLSVSSTVKNSNQKIYTFIPPKKQVAISMATPILGQSNNKSSAAQEVMLAQFNMIFKKDFPGLKMSMGEVWEYAHAAKIFREEYKYQLFYNWRTRTITKSSPRFNILARIGNYDKLNRLVIDDSFESLGEANLYVCLMLEPD